VRPVARLKVPIEEDRRKLDDIDRRILRLLQKDGRMSITEIARRIGGLTKVAVSYRVRRLIKTGVILGFTAKVDPEMLGQSFLFATQLVMKEKSGPRSELAARKVASLKGVQFVFLTFGEYDAFVIARAEDAAAARDLVYEMYRKGGAIASTTWVSHTPVKESTEVQINL
jgi:Lrp/AsnC family leucine-responsive transcriptional regulator